VAPATYPADPAGVALRLFQEWLGRRYARSTRVAERLTMEDGLSAGTITVGRKWPLAFAILNTFAAGATVPFEAARAALERRIDAEGRSIALWIPPGGVVPAAEPGLSALVAAVGEARAVGDGRLEVRRPVTLYLHRVDASGSVITIAGGLAGHWARFTSRVPGTFSLNSNELLRPPVANEERDALTESIVLAAGQAGDRGVEAIRADDAWTANDLGEGGSCVLGSPRPNSDEASAALRRDVRKLLRRAEAVPMSAAAAKALVLLGGATYAEEGKLSWAIRGMDPALYSGYDIIVTVTDGLARALLEPPANTLPWDVAAG